MALPCGQHSSWKHSVEEWEWMWATVLRGCKIRWKVTWYSSVFGVFGGHLTKCLTSILEMVAERGGLKAARVKEIHLGMGTSAADIHGSPLCPRAMEGREGSWHLNGKFTHIFLLCSSLQGNCGEGPNRQGRARGLSGGCLSWQPHLALQCGWVRESIQLRYTGGHWAGQPASTYIVFTYSRERGLPNEPMLSSSQFGPSPPILPPSLLPSPPVGNDSSQMTMWLAGLESCPGKMQTWPSSQSNPGLKPLLWKVQLPGVWLHHKCV